ncbi:MAG: IS1634 family transposase [Desulfatirhabdiaceae bacterium]|nr:IS1634 family transposase [Desulfatirhabdiaceae bacterium]
MHLSYSISKYKGKTYKSYAIAESYRMGEKVKKRTIWPIGKLTEVQAKQVQLICKVIKDDNQILANLNDLVVKETKAYLDIALIDAIWQHWKLDAAFQIGVTESCLSTPLIAKILTINRCLDPCSHYSVPKWVKSTALADVLKTDLSVLNDDKLYYELDKIEQNKESIETHLFHQTFMNNAISYQYINYDLSTSYFVGYKCKLSAFGKGKIECHGRRQVLLGVLINDEGYPFKWDVFTGNTAEVTTLKHNIEACRTRFKLNDSDVTMVFDRGIISEENASLIESAQMKFISALDRNQIPGCGFNLLVFENICDDPPKDFHKYDEDLFFSDAGILDGQRLIVGFNPVLFREDRSSRQEKIQFFETYIQNENLGLQNAKRDRNHDTTKNRIVWELKRLKLKKYYHDPILHPIKVSNTLKDGSIKWIDSFKIEIQINSETLAAEKLLDGVCVFVSNHIEKQGKSFKLKAIQIIRAYREKTKIEDVFKNVKSFLKIRPFFVNTESHVKAVYTICMISYFINRFLANRRREIGEKDYLNSKELYAPFRDIDHVVLEDKSTGKIIRKSVELPKSTRKLLQQIGMEHIAAGT